MPDDQIGTEPREPDNLLSDPEWAARTHQLGLTPTGITSLAPDDGDGPPGCR